MTVFISHSSRDHVAVRLLVQNLQTAHESVWLDQSLIGGDAWWQRILHQIRSCTVFVVALSNSCLQSKPCRAEIDYAKALGLPILPVLIDDVDSFRLDPIFTVQSVDFRNPNVATGAALIAAVRERAAERKELPDPLPESPPVPYEYLQRLGVAIDSPQELSPIEQATILIDLRQALRSEDDESVRADIHRLLRSLRRRSETTHGTVDEIDDLLRRYPAAGAGASPPGQKSDALPPGQTSAPQTSSPEIPIAEPGTPASTKSGGSIRNPKTIAVAAGAVALIAIIAVVAYLLLGRTSSGSSANKPAPSSPPTLPAVPAAALDGLLLTPEEANSTLGSTAMVVTDRYDSILGGPAVSPSECQMISNTADPSLYTGSRWTANRGQILRDNPVTHKVDQEVVLFPSAHDAEALFTAASEKWQKCSAAGKFTLPKDNGTVVWDVGPVSNQDGMLSLNSPQENGPQGWACQRALTTKSNVAIEVQVCSYLTNPAVRIAQQIAAKVAKQ